jgi:glycosyltransferase involved in cell wall biosynthesis
MPGPTITHRLLRIITRLNIGGPAIQALMLSRELSPEYSTVLAAGASPPEEGEMSDPNVPVHLVPLGRDINPVTDTRTIYVLRRLITRVRPQILHTHMAKAGALGRWAAIGSSERPKTVHTFHGHVLQGYFKPPVERAFIEIERRLARRTDALIAVSDQVRDDLLARGIGTPERMHVIPLGFDLTPFVDISGRSGVLRRKLGLEAETPLVGVLGRLAPVKDHSTLLHAMLKVPTAHLVVLGDGELRASLQQEGQHLGLSDRAHFLGWQMDVAGCIADMDVVALTSRNEGTPVSLIEALACARPVVATDVGGVRSVVDDGVTGFLAPEGAAAHVGGLLHRLLQDADLRGRMGEEGRRRVKDRFAKERLIAEIRDLYESLLS